MEQPISPELVRFLYIFLILAVLSLLIAILLLGWIIWRVKQIKLSPNADFMTALRATPLVVVIFLDLLDFSLDFFSAPIAWVVLGRLGLAPLRGVTIVEELIPGTQLIPVMTLAWIVARLTKGQSWKIGDEGKMT
jgi:hypothetical protein